MIAVVRTAQDAVPSRARVLVVDDEAFIGKMLVQLLGEHEVVPVPSAADALAVIAVGRPFDVILCDVVLRGGSGVELLSRLWRERPDQAERLVFLVNGYVSSVVTSLLEGTSNLCLEMPLDLDGLRALIERRMRTPSVVVRNHAPRI